MTLAAASLPFAAPPATAAASNNEGGGGGRRLPAPGGDPGAIAMHVLRLAYESAQDQRRAAFERASEEGLNYYLGNQWGDAPAGGFVRLTINRVQNCVISLQAIQASDPPKIAFTARESGEPPLVFLNTHTEAGRALAAAERAADPAFDPATPLPPEMADHVRQQVEMGELLSEQARAAGLPPPQGVIPEEAIVEVTERTAAEALQTVFDAMEEECNARYTFAENVLNKNVLGAQPTLYEFDDARKCHVVKNVHPKHWFVDPTAGCYEHAQYEIFIEPISEDEAVARYPSMAQEIRDSAAAGALKFRTIAGFTPGYPFNLQFQRGMVVIYHCWVRNQPYPMTEDEAVAAGLVVRGEMPTGEVTVPPAAAAAAADPAAPGAVLPPEPVMRPALFLAATGAELAAGPASPGWPVKYRVRQIRTINNVLADDRESEFADLPIPWNVNIPIPFCPYGQGEPERLQGLQDALNRVVSSIVTHTQYNAVPPELVRSDVADKMGAKLRNARATPGSRTLVPPEVANLLGNDLKKVLQYAETADLPADFWKLLEFLVRMIDQEGNQADVTQGNAAAGWSGDAIAALQNAATQVIRGKSMWTEFWLKHLARLKVHSILTRMAPADWARLCRKYPPEAIEALHALALRLELNISVQIKSASGASRQQQTSALLAAAGSGRAPVSPQTVLESLDLDPDVEVQQTLDWQRKMQPAAAAAAPAAAAAAAAPPGAAPRETGEPGE